MNKIMKRVLALTLTVCSLLAVMTPTVFAAATTQTWDLQSGDGNKYEIMTGTVTSGYTKMSPNVESTVPAGQQSPTWTYLNQTRTGGRLRVESGYINYNAVNAANNEWFAVKIRGVQPGAYQAQVVSQSMSTGGTAKMYLVDSDIYATVIAGYKDGTKYGSKRFGTGAGLNSADEKQEFIDDLRAARGILCENTFSTTTTMTQNIGVVELDKTEYVLVFQAYENKTGTSTCSIAVRDFNLKPIAASVGGVGYATVGAAITAATEDGVASQITLYENATVADLSLPAGDALDLNGNTLTVTGDFTTADGGTLIDSTGGDGLLKVAENSASFMGSAPVAANTLPLYDGTNAGYRLFGYTPKVYQAIKDTNAADETAVFWFDIDFTKDAAYNYVSGMDVGFNLSWEGGSLASSIYFDDATVSGWAGNKNNAFYVKIKNVSGCGSVTVTTFIESAGATINLRSATYTPAQ